jgi:hypothetical protein
VQRFHLHARSGNGPSPDFEIEFFPARADQLAGADKGERRDLVRALSAASVRWLSPRLAVLSN